LIFTQVATSFDMGTLKLSQVLQKRSPQMICGKPSSFKWYVSNPEG